MSNHTPSTRNVTRLFRTATAEDMATGAAWYAEANSYAHALAECYGVSVQQAAGVIAAVSPLQSWGANKALAARILDTRNFSSGYLGAGLRKAERILAGEDVATVLNGLKITNFYLGILTAGAEGVCIDRHAWSLAVNHRYEGGHIPSLSPKRYAAAVDAYVRAARILSREYGQAITPAQVQSVTWTLWRRKFWADGAFDGERAEVAA
jgi:hypothetical protein